MDLTGEPGKGEGLREEGSFAARLIRKHLPDLTKTRALIADAHKEIAAAAAFGNPVSTATQSDSTEQFEIVEESTGETLFSDHNASHFPRIGETVTLHQEDGTSTSYAVANVLWEFHPIPGAPTRRKVKMLVSKVSPA